MKSCARAHAFVRGPQVRAMVDTIRLGFAAKLSASFVSGDLRTSPKEHPTVVSLQPYSEFLSSLICERQYSADQVSYHINETARKGVP
jgi:hypothetical protein